MITYLRLQNFRRHVDTELRFEQTDQIVIVSGNNGVGKTTIFESVLWALYGEGRNGRANVERLVRRGGEFEGMQVEVEFTLGDVVHRVVRRRDSQVTSAVLWVNDVAKVEGPREVTAEIAATLGMDARGFKVATYAQQKELNGLASMRPAERGQMLSRLLRLDVVARAKESAKAEFRRQRDVLRELGAGEDLDALHRTAGEVRAQLESNERALDDARAAVVAIDAELAATSSIEAAYSSAVEHRLRIAALVDADRGEVERLEAELASIVVPEAIEAPAKSLAELQARSSEVERLIARGEERRRQHSQRGVVAAEIQRCDARLDAIDELLASMDPTPLQVAHGEYLAARTAFEVATEEQDHLRSEYAAVGERLAAAERALERARTLDAECLACGQAVPEHHRHEQVAAATVALEETRRLHAGLRRDGLAAKGRTAAAKAACDEADARHKELQRQADERTTAAAERTELLRRRDVYLDQLGRLDEGAVDLTDLYAERAEVALHLTLVAQAKERAALRDARIERRDGIALALSAAVTRLAEHTTLYEQSELDADLSLAHERRTQQLEARVAEQEVVGELLAAVAAWRERLDAVRASIERAERARTRRGELEVQAQVNHWTAEVLDEVETQATRQIRPSLEGGVGELLARLSDGRFDAVHIDDEYNISVRDDGVLRPLPDLSGGEVDLVSLAVRLALSSVVAERHGSGGVGFLILDEPIGSQDPARRGSILNALRTLKASHGQIFLISHVGGLEDAADAVVDVELDEERHAVASKQ